MSHGLIRLQPESLTLSGLPIYVARIPAAPFPRAPFSFSLGVMGELLRGRVQSGKGDAAHWLRLFNAAYSRKLQMPVYPGSLNLALDHHFDWFAPRYKAFTIWFDREEYGGERDILLMPCELVTRRTTS